MYICKHPHHPPERCLRHGVEGVFKVNVDPINSFALSPSFLLDQVHLCMLMPMQRPCLPPLCPGSKMLAGSTIFFNRSLMTSSAIDTRCLARLLVVDSTVHSCLHLCEAAKWCCSSFPAVDCVFCQNFIHPHFHNLELLVRHRFCEFIRASVWTCAFAWFQTHCEIFLNLLAGEFSSQTVWLMLCCPISVNQ